MNNNNTDNEFNVATDYHHHHHNDLESPLPPADEHDHTMMNNNTKVSSAGRFLRPRNWARLIVIVYFLFLPPLGYAGFLFFQNTVADFAAPENTLVSRATAVAEKYLPDQVFRDPAFLLISRKDGGDVLVPNQTDSQTTDICILTNFVRRTGETEFNSTNPQSGGYISTDGFCNYIESPGIGSEFYSKDKKLTMIMINMLKTSKKGSSWPLFQKKIETFMQTNSSLFGLQMKITSEGQILDETEESVLGDLVLIDGIAIPIAFLTLALCLRSFRMLIVAGCQISVTVAYMFGLLYGISTRIGISSFAPECSSAVIVALSIDYSLFIGSRFNERVKIAILDGTDIYDEDVQLDMVVETTKLCAHNICVSGAAIGIALAGLIIVPLQLIATIGIAFFVGTMVAVIVAMTLQPAILLSGFEFFAHDPGFNFIFKNVPFLAKLFADDMDEDFLPSGVLLEEQQEKVERGLEVEEDLNASELKDISTTCISDKNRKNMNNSKNKHASFATAATKSNSAASASRGTMRRSSSEQHHQQQHTARTASTDGAAAPPSLILTPATSARSHSNSNKEEQEVSSQKRVLFFAVNDDDSPSNNTSFSGSRKNSARNSTHNNNNTSKPLEEGLLSGTENNDKEEELKPHHQHHHQTDATTNETDAAEATMNGSSSLNTTVDDTMMNNTTNTNNPNLLTPSHGSVLSPRIDRSRPSLQQQPHSNNNNGRSPRSPTLTSLSVASYEQHLSPTEARRHQIARRAQNNSAWFKVGQFAVRNSCFVVVVLMLLLIPFVVAVSYLDVSFDLFSQVPRGSEKVETLDEVLRKIGTGALSAPFFVAIDSGKPHGLGYPPNDLNFSLPFDGLDPFFPPSSSSSSSLTRRRNIPKQQSSSTSNTVSSDNNNNFTTAPTSVNPSSTAAAPQKHGFEETVFQVLQQFVVYIAGRTGIGLDRISSYVAFPGAGLGFLSFEADALIACSRIDTSEIPPQYLTGQTKQILQGCREYNQLVNRTVDPTFQVALLIVAPPFDTFGPKANKFLNDLNKAIDEFDKQGMFTAGFYGASAVDWQVLQSMLAIMPTQIGMTFGIIFIIVAVVFRSAVIPFRMLFTMLYTLIVSFGAAVFLFQTPGVREVWGSNSPHAFVWLIPLFAFSLLSALALDYDVFILSRIVEYKKLGFSNEAACCKAIWKSGRVVTFACMIMFISFASMLLSKTQMLQQFGFIAGVAVLIDGFVIRSFLVPALLNFQLPKNTCWYPLRFEDETRPAEDMTESTAE